MCGICGVRLLDDDVSDKVRGHIALAFNRLQDNDENALGIDGSILLENNAAAAGIAYYFNVALNHRGRASSGIFTFDGQGHFYGGMGLATQVFNLENLVNLPGVVATGHDRYATTGLPKPENIQPHVLSLPEAVLSLAHNGNITNEAELREIIIEEEKRLHDKIDLRIKSTTDSELLLHSIALESYKHPNNYVQNTIKNSMRGIRGAYSIVCTIDDKLIAFRDSYGFRPLFFAQIGDDIAVFASEEHVIRNFAEAAGYATRNVRIWEVGNGKLVIADGNGITEYKQTFPKRKKRFCSFELSYLQAPEEDDVTRLRQVLGRKLWKKIGVGLKSDVEYNVVPVLKSGILYAMGLSDASGIPYQERIKISENYSRSFMEPTQKLRRKAASDKYEFEDSYKGKAMFITDDSIVRSHTMTYIIKGLRDRGVEELHIGVGTPQIVNPCWLGIQIPDTKELIAADFTRKQVEKYFECIFYGVEYEISTLKALVSESKSVQSIVDQSILDGENRYLNNSEMTKVKKGKFSLEYLTLKDFREVFDEIGINSKEICTACMQKNGSGYVPSMKKDLQVASVV